MNRPEDKVKVTGPNRAVQESLIWPKTERTTCFKMFVSAVTPFSRSLTYPLREASGDAGRVTSVPSCIYYNEEKVDYNINYNEEKVYHNERNSKV